MIYNSCHYRYYCYYYYSTISRPLCKKILQRTAAATATTAVGGGRGDAVVGIGRSFGDSTSRSNSTSSRGRLLFNHHHHHHHHHHHQYFSTITTISQATKETTSIAAAAATAVSPSSSSVSFSTTSTSTSTSSTEPNPGLASIISQGISSLEATAAQIESKTRRISLMNNQISSSSSSSSLGDNNTSTTTFHSKQEPNPRQLAEAYRIQEVASECLEQLCMDERFAKYFTFSSLDDNDRNIHNEPISILQVQVNRDLKQAKIYWTLPYGILLDDRVLSNLQFYRHLMSIMESKLMGGIKDMQQNSQQQGQNAQQQQYYYSIGQKILSKHVHTRLRSYYPPKLKLLPATEEMVRQALEEIFVVDNK